MPITAQKKLKVKLDSRIELTPPTPYVIEKLLAVSSSQSFDEAKTEWALKEVVDSTCDGFSDQCHLCGQTHLKLNFTIQNEINGNVIRVGSRCIVRFGVLKGNVDVESGNMIINNFINEQNSMLAVKTLLNGVMVMRPDVQNLRNFYVSLRKVLELKGIVDPTLEQLGEICYGDEWLTVKSHNFIPYRLQTLWKNPGSIDTVGRQKTKKDPVYKEHTTFGHKIRRGGKAVSSNSGLYDVQNETIRRSEDPRYK